MLHYLSKFQADIEAIENLICKFCRFAPGVENQKCQMINGQHFSGLKSRRKHNYKNIFYFIIQKKRSKQKRRYF